MPPIMKKILYILLFLPLAILGQDNYSLSFDGVDDYVDVSSLNEIQMQSFSYLGSFQTNGINGDEQPIINTPNGIVSLFTDANCLWGASYENRDGANSRLRVDSGLVNNNEIISNIWYNFAYIVNDNSSQLYLNGVLSDSIELFEGINGTYDLSQIGSHGRSNSPNTGFFNGEINQLSIWNYTLSLEEIQSYTTCSPTGEEQDLVAYWNFNEGSGDTVYDISGNGNHGVINGATYSEDVPENNCFGCTDNLALNYDDLAGENDNSCIYNTYPLEDDNFKAYLQSNFPQTIVNDSLNIHATLGIEDINVESLEISSLDGLQYFYDLINLNCVANNLSTLPELPSQIEYINCQWNQIDTLPNFPESLKNFDGRHNLITVVPELPNTMEVLRVCFNEVTTIPELPDSLKILFCAYNYEQLTYLPDFPDHLEEVLCFDNEIEQISDIPESMYKFMMQNNSITQIPNIPEGVNILNLSNNPIECVNDYPEQFEEQLGVYPPCSFLDEYTALMDSLSSVIDSLDITLSNLDDCNTEAINALSSLQLALYNWNTIIDLQEGWNMFGYGCPSSIDVAEGLSNHTESILLVKANDGSAYIPEWDFNGIGDFTPGFGYQIKLSDSIEGFSLCDWYVNDIPVDNIVTLQDSIINMHTTNCIVDGFCGYDVQTNSCNAQEDGSDCSGNELTIYEVGDFAEGGIVFYIDESGEHGLVAALEDITEGASDPYGWGFNGFEWGCYQQAVNGADGTVIGTGSQNTLDIVAQNCQTVYGGITAAQATLNYTSEGFTDWFLPSKEELQEMYNTIANGSSQGNIGGFDTSNWSVYWSSSEYNFSYAWDVNFNNGNTNNTDKGNSLRVRAVRAF